jgi:hypothetical protein
MNGKNIAGMKLVAALAGKWLLSETKLSLL